MAMHFLGQLPERFASLFQRTTISFPKKLVVRSLNLEKFPRKHHGFYLFYPEKRRKIWKLYYSTNIVFLSSVKNLVLFLSNFYKFYALEE
jgi:hypothetical protein